MAPKSSRLAGLRALVDGRSWAYYRRCAEFKKSGFTVDYVEARHAATLARLGEEDEGPARVLAAARIGGVRLIDNVPV